MWCIERWSPWTTLAHRSAIEGWAAKGVIERWPSKWRWRQAKWWRITRVERWAGSKCTHRILEWRSSEGWPWSCRWSTSVRSSSLLPTWGQEGRGDPSMLRHRQIRSTINRCGHCIATLAALGPKGSHWTAELLLYHWGLGRRQPFIQLRGCPLNEI